MAKLIDLCSKGSSNIAQKDLAACEGQYPIYGAAGFIKNVDFYHQDKPYIAIVKDGAGVGRVMKLPAHSSVIGTMQYIIPNEGVNVSYLAYALEHMNLAKYYLGAAIPHIYFKDYCNEELPTHTAEEQNNIALSLDKVTELIALRKEQLSKLDQLVKSRFVEMFGDPVENPKGFYIATLQEIIDKEYIIYHLDGNHGGDYPRSEEFIDSGVPYISANCIVNGEVDFTKAKYLSPERANKLRKGIVRDDDVLFAHNATVGPTAVLHSNEEKVILGTSLTGYRCNKNRILPNYLKHYMMSDGFIRQYSFEMKQTTRNQIPITAQRKYFFLLPPIQEQQLFSLFVEQVDKSKLAIQQSLDKLELLKKSLMQEYFG